MAFLPLAALQKVLAQLPPDDPGVFLFQPQQHAGVEGF
jgi:hypothetical protein